MTKLDSWQVAMYLGGTWTDATRYVMIEDGIVCRWGITGNDPKDRLASTGTMRFTLNNTNGLFSPGGPACMAGWQRGVYVGVLMVFEGVEYKRFFGRVSEIAIESGTVGGKFVKVTAVDWMDYAASFPLINPALQLDKTADVALTTIEGSMSIQPQNSLYDTGTVTFPALFDTTTIKTLAYSEYAKIVNSEGGYLYLLKDRISGETLVFENAYHRNGLRTLTQYPAETDASSGMDTEAGDPLTTEAGIELRIDMTKTFTADNTMINAEASYGEHLINRVTVVAYPKSSSAADEILYSLSSPMQLASREVKTFRAGYTDPTGGGARVNAIPSTMVTPVATTHYLMNSKSDGTGTNLTASLTVVAVYGTEGITYTLTNGATGVGYVTFLVAKGRGIFAYNPIEVTFESPTSYNEYGYVTITIDQVLNRDLVYGSMNAASTLEENKIPETRINRVTFSANRSSENMQAFLNLDVGDLIHIIETKTAQNKYYYIQDVEFTVSIGGIVMFSWIVKQVLSLTLGLSLIGAEFAAGSTDSIKYGYIPQIVNQNLRTISAWVYPTSEVSDVRIIAGAYAAAGGWFVYMSNGHLLLYQEAPTTAGVWSSVDHVRPTDEWHHIAVTRDCTGTAAPKMYIDGVESSITEVLHPGGVYNDESGAMFAIGNLDTAAHPLDYPFDGQIMDVRFYNRILSLAEVNTIMTLATYKTVTDGLLFEGPTVKTSELTYFTDHTLAGDDRLSEAIYGMIGVPVGGVITRNAAPFVGPPAP